ncbi:response regulator [Spongisporangium articulatum]|uniref:Response regulator n=1 Tax=Spongisporangium articulatum TaxID=3362603 RepID=A0ABW8APZ8_9ACTN
MRVVIVEDEALFRHGLVSLLAGSEIDVVGTAGDAGSALDVVRRARPDLLITDVRIPPGGTTDGLDTALQLRREQPGLAVMVLSQFVARRHGAQLLRQDARGVGYQLKQRVGHVPTFLADLRRVAGGGTALDPDVVRLLLGHAGDPVERLTPRQREVLALVAQGRSNAAIAARLGIGEKAVVAHTSRIYDELGIHEDGDDHRRVLAVLRFLAGD